MFTIDEAACIGCASCVTVCPSGLFSLGEDGKAKAPNQKRCMRCMHCTATCPTRAVHFEDVPAGEAYSDHPSGGLERLVTTRRSIRHYRDELPPRELIQWALDTAEYAPSGHNMHTHRWTVLWGRGETDRAVQAVFDWALETRADPTLTILARQKRNLITCGAPCVLLCHSGQESPNHTIDAAIAMETVELLLAERGVSTCWAGYLQRLSNHVPALQQRLELPEGHRVRCAMMVGYADGEQYPNRPWRPKAQPRWLETE